MERPGIPLILLDAPSNLGLMPPGPNHEPGVRFAPSALREAGIQALLGVEDGTAVDPPPYRFERPADSKVRNLDGLRSYAGALAVSVDGVVAAGGFPVVLGGDCSILLGPMLALRRRGRYGLVFVDGHTDVQSPEDSATGGAAGMDLALVTGRGPAALVDFDGCAPLVRADDVVAIGFRDGTELRSPAVADLADAGATFLPLGEARRRGLTRTATGAVTRFAEAGADGFWMHVDVDVLDSDLMPAVDSPQPDGMTYQELVEVLRPLLASPRAMGIEVTIFDPERDTGGYLARRLAETLAASFPSTSLHPSSAEPPGGALRAHSGEWD
jgi:arginase